MITVLIILLTLWTNIGELFTMLTLVICVHANLSSPPQSIKCLSPFYREIKYHLHVHQLVSGKTVMRTHVVGCCAPNYNWLLILLLTYIEGILNESFVDIAKNVIKLAGGPGQHAQWLESHSEHQGVRGSIADQGHVPGLHCCSQLQVRANVGGSQSMHLSHIDDVSLSLSFPFPTPLHFSRMGKNNK